VRGLGSVAAGYGADGKFVSPLGECANNHTMHIIRDPYAVQRVDNEPQRNEDTTPDGGNPPPRREEITVDKYDHQCKWARISVRIFSVILYSHE